MCAWEPGKAGITALPISPAQPVALESLVGKGPLSHTLMEGKIWGWHRLGCHHHGEVEEKVTSTQRRVHSIGVLSHGMAIVWREKRPPTHRHTVTWGLKHTV